ncbi:hypothetical protein EDD16DRAFT_151382 [Pisolithus croceorrhizus]|nr:hypothetical protein EDD16DRAFT_151382 [Pisolithus croceorrhizus]
MKKTITATISRLDLRHSSSFCRANMTTTWTLRHPWLDSSAFKRRLPGDEGDLDEHYLSSGSPFKRRKCHSLEHGFACMTLNQAASTAFPSVTSAEQHYSTQTVLNDENKPMYLASSVQGVVLPSSIEEPPSPDTDVEMDVEDDLPSDASRLAPTIREESMLEVNEIKIPSTVLEHWKQQVRSSPIIPITSPGTSTPSSQALVLFRPLRPPSPIQNPRDGARDCPQNDTLDVPSSIST